MNKCIIPNKINQNKKKPPQKIYDDIIQLTSSIKFNEEDIINVALQDGFTFEENQKR
mgnify:FL=1